MPSDLIVSGDTYISDVVLQKDSVKFETNSRLIITVDKEHPDAPRTVTIIANSFTITDQAVITYDLDGRTGVDPETPPPPQSSTAQNGPNGSPHYWPDDTTPGSYPHAANGGPGMPGQRGKKGTDGVDAPTLQIWVGDISAGSMTIDLRGQDGGNGGNGGDGGKGGGGQKGAKSQKEDAWYDGEECTREPGQGGNGGQGGDAGWPGSGGDGGKGGIVRVFTKSASLAKAQSWTYKDEGGKGGKPGNAGKAGEGGQGAPQGDKVGPCPSRPEFKGEDGPRGREMDDIDPNWETNLRGEDGKDGDDSVHEVNIMPH